MGLPFNEDLKAGLKRWRQEKKRADVEDLLQRAAAGEAEALASLADRGMDSIPVLERLVFAGQFYAAAKRSLASYPFTRAGDYLKMAGLLDPGNWLLQRRLRLLSSREMIIPGTVPWNLAIIDMGQCLGMTCLKKPCTCQTSMQIAACQGALEKDYDHEGRVATSGFPSVKVYTVGGYYAYNHLTKWTRWLKKVKHPPFEVDLLRPMGDIAASFIVERTRLMEQIDLVVPIPPDPAKFAERGFAPNDILAGVLEKRLALPMVRALRREDGSDTKSSSTAMLAAQFKADKEVNQIKGLNVLLAEDIWTAGRTIPICADKLIKAGAKGVVALALGHTS